MLFDFQKLDSLFELMVALETRFLVSLLMSLLSVMVSPDSWNGLHFQARHLHFSGFRRRGLRTLLASFWHWWLNPFLQLRLWQTREASGLHWSHLRAGRYQLQKLTNRVCCCFYGLYQDPTDNVQIVAIWNLLELIVEFRLVAASFRLKNYRMKEG